MTATSVCVDSTVSEAKNKERLKVIKSLKELVENQRERIKEYEKEFIDIRAKVREVEEEHDKNFAKEQFLRKI